jgi:ribonuclease HI
MSANIGFLNILHVELLAIYYGLAMAWELDIKELWYSSDSKIVIKLLIVDRDEACLVNPAQPIVIWARPKSPIVNGLTFLRLDTPTKRFISVTLSVIRAPYAFIVLSF